MTAPSDRELLAHRRPFEELEAELLKRALARPGEVTEPLMAGLRYVVNFAKIGLIESAEGTADARELLTSHALHVQDTLAPRLAPEEETLWSAIRALPDLLKKTRTQRDRIERYFGVSREVLNREVCEKQLAVVLGGGGGAGYGYAGIFRALANRNLPVKLICGTSIGALTGAYRARREHYDPQLVYATLRGLSWNKVFSVGPSASRYGLPATLRLHLRRAIGAHFTEGGRVMAISDLPVRFHVVTTGLTVDALKHDLTWYEHFLDDAVARERGRVIFRGNYLSRLGNVAQIFMELAEHPDALREVVFGLDPLTMDADCLDAVGFSAAVPGMIHYDILREDPRAQRLMDALYAEYGISRLTEGGVVNNVPARVAFRSAMQGTLDGHRNVWVAAFDCFAPRRTSLWYPVQQIVRGNVLRNRPYANLYLSLPKALNPANLVPRIKDLELASEWARDAFAPHLPLVTAACAPFEAVS